MITVSEAAASQLKTLMAKQDDDDSNTKTATVGLRVFVKEGGCSGFSYGMGLDEQPPNDDDQVVEQAGFKVYVDAFSAQYLEGAEIDYDNALMGGGFTINNPNATTTCGCGHSFQTADKAGKACSCSH